MKAGKYDKIDTESKNESIFCFSILIWVMSANKNTIGTGDNTQSTTATINIHRLGMRRLTAGNVAILLITYTGIKIKAVIKIVIDKAAYQNNPPP